MIGVCEVFVPGLEGIWGLSLSSGFGGGRAASGVDMFVKASRESERKRHSEFSSFILQEKDVLDSHMMIKDNRTCFKYFK